MNCRPFKILSTIGEANGGQAAEVREEGLAGILATREEDFGFVPDGGEMTPMDIPLRLKTLGDWFLIGLERKNLNPKKRRGNILIQTG